MAREANTPQQGATQDLTDAFNVHAALVAAEKGRPHLKHCPRWQIIRMDAYEALMRLWWGSER